MKTYSAIDFGKIIAAYLVLILHVSPFADYGLRTYFREVVCILAVPFFFCTSGFLISKSSDKSINKLVKKSKDNYRRYIIWSVIYLPCVAFEWVISEKGFFENIVGYVRDFLFEGSYLTIWFLNALAISFIIMACLLRKFSARCCFVISLPLYLCALLLSSYHEVLVKFPLGEFISNAYYSVFSSTKNGVLFAFPFVSMGYYLGTAENAKLKKSQYGALSVLLYLGLNVEVFLRESFYGNERSVDFAVMLVPLIWVLVRILSEIEIKDLFVKNKSAFVFLRKMSVLIFLTQRLFIFTFDTIEAVIYKYYGKEIFEQLPTARFLLISGSVSLFSYMVIKLSERYNWVKKIC